MVDPIRIESVSGNTVTAVFFYPQATPATSGETVPQPWVPSPSTGIPSVVQGQMLQAEKDDVDAGLEIWETLSMEFLPGQLPAEILASLRARYAARLAAFPAWYANQTAYYQYVGTQYAAS